MNVLIIDDERNVLNTTAIAVETAGHTPFTAYNTRQANRQLAEEDIEVILLDRMLGREDGLEYMEHLKKEGNQTPVIIFTAHSSIESAVHSMRKGAYTYIQKPFVPEQIRIVLDQLGKQRSQSKKLEQLQKEVSSSRPELILTSKNAETQRAYDMAFKAAQSDASILLLGPSGTGKSLLAKQLHEASGRSDESFVTVSCPSLSRELLESELFGYVKGAFTGAVNDSWGKIHAADKGTCFLDEIGEMPIEIQPKLLRLLQEHQYERLGETKTRTADIRVISATNRTITNEVQAGNFREDLLYRLNVITVTLPPLNQRPEDIFDLASNFLAHYSAKTNTGIQKYTDEAIEAMTQYTWPGNLREMSNVIERAVILSEGDAIHASDLHLKPAINGAEPDSRLGARMTIEELTSEHIKRVIDSVSNMGEAAKILDIDTATLYRKRKKMGLLK